MITLPLTPDQVLSTTRAVRRRLDLTRPVEREVLEECLSLAQQAPRASNVERRAFVVVTDREKKEALAVLWRSVMEPYLGRGGSSSQSGRLSRMTEGVRYLGDHLADVPVLVVPCVQGRLDGRSVPTQAALWGTIAPAIWSFMLAARTRGLGTVWTTFHLFHEKETADILGIPYEEWTQTSLIPVAYTLGTDFKPGPRESLSDIVHWDRW